MLGVVVWVSVSSWNGLTSRRKCRGEERTGPALNPLKGSSARLPHCPRGCNLQAILKCFIIIEVELHFPVKKLYPFENLPGAP
jgi:hypothetical protein